MKKEKTTIKDSNKNQKIKNEAKNEKPGTEKNFSGNTSGQEQKDIKSEEIKALQDYVYVGNDPDVPELDYLADNEAYHDTLSSSEETYDGEKMFKEDDLNDDLDDDLNEDDENCPDFDSPFNHLPEMQIEMPQFLNPATRFPVLRVESACAMPFVPMSLPNTFDENEDIVRNAISKHEPVVIIFQDMAKYSKGTSKGLSRFGVWAKIINRASVREDEPSMMLAIGGPRIKVEKFNTYKGQVTATAKIEEWEMPDNEKAQLYVAAQLQEISDAAEAVRKLEKRRDMPEVIELLKKLHEVPFLSSIIFAMSLAPSVKNDILKMKTFIEVGDSVLHHLSNLRQLLELRRDINHKVTKKLDSNQREVFIQHQIEMLQQEVGQGSTSDINKLLDRAGEKVWSEETQEHFDRELAKLRRLSPSTPDYSIQFTYLDTILNLPWNNQAEVTIDLDKIEHTLDEDHFGLERVKERILEQMAVAALRKDNKSPILCLVGPPGVGKTSLGKSIARAMGREYGRVAFGGLHDEAEIRGHRRTYIGAMPGRIIAALLKTDYSNPVIVLDEIDKIGKDYKGDPSTALLEVLDPEQNSRFHDNYIDTDYDLSHILFIATANSLETVSGPLRDRMEIISIPGYIAEEKIEIAKRHLVKKQLEANGLREENIIFSDEALNYIIEYYTRESGVRRLEKMIGKALRKLAVKKVRGEKIPSLLDKTTVSSLLGKEEFNPEMYENNDNIGVVTGLAWTQVGGEILFIESTVTEGKGNLTLTGNLGDVMKESATLALQYLKSHAKDLNLAPEIFDKRNTHIHVPEGAIPKDGPSAGITMATSLASSFTGRKVRPNIAMTGEITLRGKVLPVGGIREKIIAAKRSGIKEIILSKENKKDILEVKQEYLKGLSFIYVDTVSEVLERALL